MGLLTNLNKLDMKQSIALIKAGFESTSQRSREFEAFSRIFKREFKKELENADCTLEKFSVGHFYISGFFKSPSGELYYFSTLDMRHFSDIVRMYYRTAMSTNDYTGGHNQWMDIESNMIVNLNLL